MVIAILPIQYCDLLSPVLYIVHIQPQWKGILDPHSGIIESSILHTLFQTIFLLLYILILHCHRWYLWFEEFIKGMHLYVGLERFLLTFQNIDKLSDVWINVWFWLDWVIRWLRGFDSFCHMITEVVHIVDVFDGDITSIISRYRSCTCICTSYIVSDISFILMIECEHFGILDPVVRPGRS